MSTLLNFETDVGGRNAYAPNPCTDIYTATLGAGTPASLTVHSKFAVWVVAFSVQPGADVWVNFSGAAASVPAGGTLTASTSTLNPGQRRVLAGSTISVITGSTTADISIELYPVSYA